MSTRRRWLQSMASGAFGLTFGSGRFTDIQTSAGWEKPMTALGESRATTEKTLDADVVVVGGGMAGVCSAIAAARNGASVVLIQDRPVLGGNSSSEIRMHIVGADCHGSRNDTDARETGILEELRLECAVRNPQRSASMWDLLLYEWVKREPNITLLLNTSCVGVEVASENRIGAVIALRNSTEDVFTVRGKVFIDCSGDGRLGIEVGAEFRKGREGRDEFGESLALPKPDNKTLGSSILFVTRKHDRPMPFKPPDWIRKFPHCEDLPHRAHSSWEYGFWWVEWGGELDTIKDNERIRDELHAIALGVWDHIKNSGLHPESENWALEWIGFLPGKRESRRFVGDYILTQHDLQRGEVFEDGVAYGGWSIDLHPPEGIDTKEPPNIAVKIPLYNIPFRSLYSLNIDNLLFAGRNISATHVAFGSTRVMGTCSMMGQGVGTAAALCVQYNCTPRELGKEAIKELQQLLLKQDAYIIGVSNSDPHDIARTAKVRASSEMRDYEAVNVINGVHRGVYASKNRWASDPMQPMPQWLELHFREPKRIREVHLTFDTGLNRELTLSFSDWVNRRMIWGPQPETVRDYELQVLYGESAKKVAKVESNYQRKRVHQFEPQLATGIRLIVYATNGDKSARVFEVRVYE